MSNNPLKIDALGTKAGNYRNPNPDVNSSGQSFSQTRGKDSDFVLNKINLDFTVGDTEVYPDLLKDGEINLVMPQYGRKVEIDDLNKNFWTLSVAFSKLIQSLKDGGSIHIMEGNTIYNIDATVDGAEDELVAITQTDTNKYWIKPIGLCTKNFMFTTEEIEDRNWQGTNLQIKLGVIPFNDEFGKYYQKIFNGFSDKNPNCNMPFIISNNMTEPFIEDKETYNKEHYNLVLAEHATTIFRGDSNFTIKDNANVALDGNSEFFVHDNAKLHIDHEANVFIHDDAKIYIENGLPENYYVYDENEYPEIKDTMGSLLAVMHGQINLDFAGDRRKKHMYDYDEDPRSGGVKIIMHDAPYVQYEGQTWAQHMDKSITSFTDLSLMRMSDKSQLKMQDGATFIMQGDSQEWDTNIGPLVMIQGRNAFIMNGNNDDDSKYDSLLMTSPNEFIFCGKASAGSVFDESKLRSSETQEGRDDANTYPLFMNSTNEFDTIETKLHNALSKNVEDLRKNIEKNPVIKIADDVIININAGEYSAGATNIIAQPCEMGLVNVQLLDNAHIEVKDSSLLSLRGEYMEWGETLYPWYNNPYSDDRYTVCPKSTGSQLTMYDNAILSLHGIWRNYLQQAVEEGHFINETIIEKDGQSYFDAITNGSVGRSEYDDKYCTKQNSVFYCTLKSEVAEIIKHLEEVQDFNSINTLKSQNTSFEWKQIWGVYETKKENSPRVQIYDNSDILFEDNVSLSLTKEGLSISIENEKVSFTMEELKKLKSLLLGGGGNSSSSSATIGSKGNTKLASIENESYITSNSIQPLVAGYETLDKT